MSQDPWQGCRNHDPYADARVMLSSLTNASLESDCRIVELDLSHGVVVVRTQSGRRKLYPLLNVVIEFLD
jgi:hypothetical protein